nr:unnamed protein product [Digitaria exilis]
MDANGTPAAADHRPQDSSTAIILIDNKAHERDWPGSVPCKGPSQQTPPRRSSRLETLERGTKLEEDVHPRAGVSVTIEAQRLGSRETFTLERAFSVTLRAKLEPATPGTAPETLRPSSLIINDLSVVKKKDSLHHATAHAAEKTSVKSTWRGDPRRKLRSFNTGPRARVATLEPELEGAIPARIVRGMGSTIHLVASAPRTHVLSRPPPYVYKRGREAHAKGRKKEVDIQQELGSSPPSPTLLVTPYYEQHETGAPHHCWTYGPMAGTMIKTPVSPPAIGATSG